MKNAVCVWLSMMLLTAIFACCAAWQIDFLLPAAIALTLLLAAAVLSALALMRQHTAKHGKRIEAISGIWTLSLYLMLGAVPWVWRWATSEVLVRY
jgi:hypothetical protein